MSTSPQSTLGNWSGWSAGGSNVGSPNSAPLHSVLLVAKSDAVVDLICKAAGQVAKLQLNSGDGLSPSRNLGLVCPPRSPAQIYSSTRALSPSTFQPIQDPAPPITAKKENPGCGMWYGPQQQFSTAGAERQLGEWTKLHGPSSQNRPETSGRVTGHYLWAVPDAEDRRR